jgi:hypothetical protein
MRKIHPEEVRGWGVSERYNLWGWGFCSFLFLGKEKFLPFSRASCLHEAFPAQLSWVRVWAREVGKVTWTSPSPQSRPCGG